MKLNVQIFILSLLLCELCLRGSVQLWDLWQRKDKPLVYLEESSSRPDERLGWRLAAGRYPISIMDRDASYTTAFETIGQDGWRITEPSPHQTTKDEPHLYLSGCSFMFGFGLPDQETLPWKTQERLPGTRVFNRGVTGYNHYQAFMAAQDYLPEDTAEDITVVVGVSNFHFFRNTGAPSLTIPWAQRVGSLRLPSCDWDQNHALLCKMFQFPSSLLSHYSYIARILEAVSLQISTPEDKTEAAMATVEILKNFKEWCEARGIRFVLMLQRFHREDKSLFLDAIAPIGFEVIDGADPAHLSDDFALVGDEHPNARLTTEWANLLTHYFRTESIS